MQQPDQLMKQRRQIDALSMTNGAIVAAHLINDLEWNLLEEIVTSGGDTRFQYAQFLDKSDPTVAEKVTLARLRMPVEEVSAVCSCVRSRLNVEVRPAHITEADVEDAAQWIRQNCGLPVWCPAQSLFCAQRSENNATWHIGREPFFVTKNSQSFWA
jgi:hypothetical protein